MSMPSSRQPAKPPAKPQAELAAKPPPKPPELAPDSPTELVEDEQGELVERLSGSTATILLAWLIGIGACSALLAAWLVGFVAFGQRLGIDSLFSGFGFYTAVFGATGPVVLWLAGRAQGHRLTWFLITAAKMGLLMIAIVIVGGLLAFLALGVAITRGFFALAALLALLTLLLSVLWALAVWAADRSIARARVIGG